MLNPRGTRVELSAGGELCWDSPIQGPVWSPNGTWVGHTLHYRDSTGRILHDLVIVNASTGVIHRHRPINSPGSRFTGWADNENFIEVGDRRFVLRDAESGRITNMLTVSDWFDDEGQITPVPPQTGAYYVTSQQTRGDPVFEVRLLRKNFTVQRVVYRASGGGAAPRVDPFGEFVAWSSFPMIAVKSLSSPRSEPPTYIGKGFQSASFCDWTEDGRILASVAKGTSSELVILDRWDRLFAEIPGGAALPTHSGTASWRKYMHK